MNMPQNLGQALANYRNAYLLTAGRGAPHAVPVVPRFDGHAVIVEGIGKHTRTNVTRQPAVGLVWPPLAPAGYSLIVDGQATVAGDALQVTPTRAVLHRAGTPAEPDHAGGCAADCIELQLH